MPGVSPPETVTPSPASGDARTTVDFPIIVIGASAGGLVACKALLDHWPGESNAAFVIVQHLEPTHESMLGALLATHTTMTVTQVEDRSRLLPGHVHVIAPGKYLTVVGDIFSLSDPPSGQGVRLPLDVLLASLAREAGARTACIILSGTGADGSTGAPALKESGGFVIAQEPAEAQFGDMPRNAILTGAVDRILAIRDMPAVVAAHFTNGSGPGAIPIPPATPAPEQDSGAILDWLRLKTPHDFRLYKSGTMIRRIQRRMGLSTKTPDMTAYLEKLRGDPIETALLAQDLLINVTRFFRDPDVFDYLEKTVIPEKLTSLAEGKPLRIWVAGCSTGEEAYSLAILILEACSTAGKVPNVQFFASDTDDEAVEFARAGRYPLGIADQMTPARLDRFFSKVKDGYLAAAELRDLIVFTVHDLLADPPFARIDLVSCRNVLIYLGPEAQKRLLGLFHFALAPHGLLLIGTAETAGAASSIFLPVHKPARLFRRIGNHKPSPGIFMTKETKPAAIPASPAKARLQESLSYGDLCRKLVLEHFAPAAILINDRNEWLYALGPTADHLRPASGYPTNDLLLLVAPSLRGDLATVIDEARSSGKPAHVICRPGGAASSAQTLRISAAPVWQKEESLVLVGFRNEAANPAAVGAGSAGGDRDSVVQLQRQLADARSALATAIANLESAKAAQAATNAEAISVNEELQSANEELLTSKEELQSLNEELTALNMQLQETLDLYRTTSSDLQNVLYSTNVATIFLDAGLRIRFFTPATKALFNVIPGDMGRPLSDLSSLASDASLLDDARLVLVDGQARDREIKAHSGAWYLRRILPYLAQDGATEGVVITFVDVTERRHVADDLVAAKRIAETATIAKSRFLAAASHDLRQPLQTLVLLQGLLADMVVGEKPRKLVDRFGTTLAAMSSMLSTLLDINQIEAGAVHPEPVRFNINDLLAGLNGEFSYHATAQGLKLKVVPCRMEIQTDPRLLEQILRNLLSNALKYTRQGKILMGCRRHKDSVSIEIWDTGIGIPEKELQTIFDEYHQLDNPARERGRGLGLGLSIVQRLVKLLGFKTQVRSALGKGSVFAIEILLPIDRAPDANLARDKPLPKPAPSETAAGRILIVEDDPDVRELLELLLVGENYQIGSAADGESAFRLVKTEGFVPDLVLADFNLPNDMNGVQLSRTLRDWLKVQTPAIILTGDISTRTSRGIALEDCVQLNKPVKLKQLMQTVQRLLSHDPAHPATPSVSVPTPDRAAGDRVVFVVDDDAMIRASLREVLESHGFRVADFASSEEFLGVDRTGPNACLLIDAYLPGMDGFELLRTLNDREEALPSIMITGHSDVPMAVEAMKAGAADFLEKPIGAAELLDSVERVFDRARDAGKALAWRQTAIDHIKGLTARQHEVMDLVLAGHPSKNIAADLHISQRTVENHRAAIMKKTGCKSLPALARLAMVADNRAKD